MAVAQLIHFFDTLDQNNRRSKRKELRRQSSSGLRLSLQSILPYAASHKNSSSLSASPSSSEWSSPSSSRTPQRSSHPPASDLTPFFSPSRTPSPCPTKTRTIRRQRSMMDLALEAERTAMGIENIGLGLFEPRPTTVAPLPSSASPHSITASNGPAAATAAPPPIVLEGIIEVMESG